MLGYCEIKRWLAGYGDDDGFFLVVCAHIVLLLFKKEEWVSGLCLCMCVCVFIVNRSRTAEKMFFICSSICVKENREIVQELPDSFQLYLL